MERIPIIRLGDILLVSVQVDVHDRLISQLERDLGEALSSRPARGVGVDVSALQVIDTYLSRMLGLLARLAGLMSARLVLVGIRPAVAITLVELGMTFDELETALDVERAVALLERPPDVG